MGGRDRWLTTVPQHWLTTNLGPSLPSPCPLCKVFAPNDQALKLAVVAIKPWKGLGSLPEATLAS
jgi:hypothetical protein